MDDTRTFTDSSGREWTPRIPNVQAALEIYRYSGFNVMGAAEPETLRLLSDPETLVNTIFASVRGQANERGIDAVAFAESLNGQALDDGSRALLGAVADFFGGPRGEAIRSLLAASWSVQASELAKVGDLISSGGLEETIRKIMTEPARGQEIASAALSRSGRSSGEPVPSAG